MGLFKPLLKLLVDVGALKTLPAEALFEGSSEGPIRVLSRNNLIDERNAISLVAKRLAIDVYEPSDREVLALNPNLEAAGLTANFCWQNRVLPLGKRKDDTLVAFANPLDHDAIKSLEFILQTPIKLLIARESVITKKLQELFPSASSAVPSEPELKADEQLEVLKASVEEDIDYAGTDSAPVVKLVNQIITDAVRSEASDIHIEPSQNSLDVRLRIDGVMVHQLEIPKRLQPYLISRCKLLAGLDISEKRKPQDGRFRVRVSGESVDLRASTIATAFGEKIVLRVLRTEGRKLTLDNIGMPQPIKDSLHRLLANYGKMLLVTGPTGSGKTTTLYSCIHATNDGSTNIATIEDPIEYRIEGINQIQVNDVIGVDFASALRSILRQDPDVIMVGEIRDQETANMALQAAQTGHLVLSTLHTNSAAGSVTRLMNLGCENFMISACLGGVLAQRLVRKVCPDCCINATPGYLEKYAAIVEAYNLDKTKLKEPRGCQKCNGTGYKGRTGAYSLLEITDELSDLIAKGATLIQLEEAGRKNGFVDLDRAAVDLAQCGISTLDEIRPYITLRAVNSSCSEFNKANKPEVVANISPAPSNSLSKPKLLLVDDDENVRSVLSMVLQKEMFDVIEAGNGQDALEKLYLHSPQVVLCDLMMPKMDGREFLLRVKGNKQTQDIPVLILTAVDNEENEVSLIDIGATDFVSKTSSSGVMLSRIRRAISGRA